MSLRDIFARNLRKMREDKGFSQEELADEAGLHRTYIGLLERRKYDPSIKTIEKLASALEVEPASLLERHLRRSR